MDFWIADKATYPGRSFQMDRRNPNASDGRSRSRPWGSISSRYNQAAASPCLACHGLPWPTTRRRFWATSAQPVAIYPRSRSRRFEPADSRLARPLPRATRESVAALRLMVEYHDLAVRLSLHTQERGIDNALGLPSATDGSNLVGTTGGA